LAGANKRFGRAASSGDKVQIVWHLREIDRSLARSVQIEEVSREKT